MTADAIRDRAAIRAFVTTVDVEKRRNSCCVCGRVLEPGTVVMDDADRMACFGRGCYRSLDCQHEHRFMASTYVIKCRDCGFEWRCS
jgi:hypothetical protein